MCSSAAKEVPHWKEEHMTSRMSESFEECLYLDYHHVYEGCIFPLHTSVTLFLLSYCDTKLFKVTLVPSDSSAIETMTLALPKNVNATFLSRNKLSPVVQSCRLPVVVEKDGTFCRAGLAVVLRHIIQKNCDMDPGRKDVCELLGFKKTCLKACAEVSQWTRLCEISIPLAIESFLCGSGKLSTAIPVEVLHLEKKLSEPVKVHNDDKIRRQKLKQLTLSETAALTVGTAGNVCEDKEEPGMKTGRTAQEHEELELIAALSKLTEDAIPGVASREPSHIRKVKTTSLPALEHVFAEGLYFTLTDVVLLPCLHVFLAFLSKQQTNNLTSLPLISSWYLRVQEVPGVKKAAASCGIQFVVFEKWPPATSSQTIDCNKSDEEEKKMNSESAPFIGGPRPTMTKLKEHGIEATFSPHLCPEWTLNWHSLPAAVCPAEGKMSQERALRKQQQLNNLISVVTKFAKPGFTIVDFCSGGGHVGIALAYTVPSCKVILIENKVESLVRARQRCVELGLNNVWFIQANLDYFTGSFNIGVALHACGVATDMVMEHCIKAQAAFVISPCCYGFIQNTKKFTFPRSQHFRDVLSYKEHMVLCRFADQTAVQLPLERRLTGKRCMGLVDLDRAWAAKESGYSAQIISMEPESCSPKNNMVVGVPSKQHNISDTTENV
ncbi:glutathione S-transferase C-terminal domain-containing protein [Protopterus annectens]|uniref:glutathione S-transferase C-terminal domain-containing protein n=1 Tax=Protopterus annectens TaxID=7888 RepID=UPI001CFA9658|nr:glutathione S-transferase C-terminal domain-containing protein [Protopterus annectens]